MPLTAEDIKTYRSINNSNELDNGGRISNSLSITGTRGNVFTDVSDYNRNVGLEDWRKVFWKNNNDLNLTLRNAQVYMTSYTPGDDYVMFCKGTHTDTQSQIVGTTRFYGAARIKNDISVGGNILIAVLENTSMEIFADNDNIYISDLNHSEKHNNVQITKNGNEVTIVLANGDSFTNNYSSTITIVSSMLDVDDLATEYQNLVNTSVTGILNTVDNDIELFNQGTTYQNWTLKFYTSTQFTLYGDTLGYIGSGDISQDFIPLNTYFNSPYFVIYKEIWQGIWNINDEVRFTSIPASIAIWFKRIVPAGSSSTYNNFKYIISGEAATQ